MTYFIEVTPRWFDPELRGWNAAVHPILINIDTIERVAKATKTDNAVIICTSDQIDCLETYSEVCSMLHEGIRTYHAIGGRVHG